MADLDLLVADVLDLTVVVVGCLALGSLLAVVYATAATFRSGVSLPLAFVAVVACRAAVLVLGLVVLWVTW